MTKDDKPTGSPYSSQSDGAKSKQATKTSVPSSARPTRHSKPTKQPVTIDLKAEAETPKPADQKESAAKSAASVSSPPSKNAPDKKDAKPDVKLGRSQSASQLPNAEDKKIDAKKPASLPPIKKPQKPGSGLLGKFVAAVIGGIVALTAAWGLQYFGVLGSPGSKTEGLATNEALNSATESLSDRLAALEGRLKDQPEQAAGVDTEALNKAIETRLAASASNEQSKLDGLNKSIQANGQVIESIKGDLEGVQKLASNLNNAISSGTAGENAGMAAMSAQIASLTEKLNTVSNTQTAEPDTGKIDELSGTLSALQTAAKERSAALADQAEQINSNAQQATELTSSVSELSSKLTALADSTNQQAESLASLMENSTNGADKKAARAIAAAAVKSDIDQGQPFKASLDVLKSVSPNASQLDALTPFAETGIATRQALSKQFGTVQRTILAAISPAEETGVMDRLLSGAKSLVKVRRLSVLEGTSPEALISQIDGGLRDNDLEKALNAWEQLPTEGKAVSTKWQEQLSARLTADRLITSSVQSFLSSITE